MTTIVELIASIKAEGAKKAAEDISNVGKKGKQAGKEFDAGAASIVKGASAIAIAGAKMFATYKVADKMVEIIALSTQMAARYETLGTVMHTVTGNMGLSAQSSDYLAASVQSMGITMSQSRKTIISMAQAQLDLSKSAELARVSQDAAVIAGTNSSEALSRIVYGIQSGQTEVLRSIGLNVNWERSYQKLAIELGKNVSSLTEAEKAQARMNAVMEQGTRIAGSYEAAMTTVGKKVTSLARHQEDLLTKFGDIFTPAYADIIDGITDALKGMNASLDEMESNGALEQMQDAAASTFATIELLARAGWTPLVVGFNTVQTAAEGMNRLLEGDFAGAAESFTRNAKDIYNWLTNVDEGFDRIENRKNTFSFAREIGPDEFGVQQYEIVTETFEDLDDAARKAYAEISKAGMEQKAVADGVRSAIQKTDSELSVSVSNQLNSARERNALIGAESNYQRQLAEFESGRLKNVNEFLALDQEQLANSVAVYDNAIAYYKTQKDSEEIQKALAEVEAKRARTMGDLLLLQNGFTAELKAQLLAEAKKTDIIQAGKQLRDKRQELDLIGKTRSEVAALSAQRKLENKGLSEQGRIMADLIRTEHRLRAEQGVGERIQDIMLETRLVGATAREHAIATSAIAVHRDGWHDLAAAIEEAVARQYDANARFNIEAAADPTIEKNRAMRELNMLYGEGERESAGYLKAQEAINDAYLSQIQNLGKLNEAENRKLASIRSVIDLESAVNETAYSTRSRTRLESLIQEDALTQQKIASLQEEIDMLNAKDMRDEVAVNNAMARMEALKQQANKFGDTFRNVGEQGVETFFNEILTGTHDVSNAFDSMVDSIVQSMARLAAEQLAQKATGWIVNTLGSSLSGFFGGAPVATSAKGNVVTANGPVKLKRYATGGIATSPQLSIFGEGSTPEAYVPLPDGRSIPVKLEEPKAPVTEKVQPITVNVTVSNDVSPRSATQTGYQIGRAINLAQRRNS